MGKGMEGGGLGLGGVFWVFAPQSQHVMYVLLKKLLAGAQWRFPILGCWGPSMGHYLLLQLVWRRRDLWLWDAGQGQLAATRTKHSWFVPCPSFLSVRLGIPFPTNPCHKGDYS